jgi:hypothetical protein
LASSPPQSGEAAATFPCSGQGQFLDPRFRGGDENAQGSPPWPTARLFDFSASVGVDFQPDGDLDDDGVFHFIAVSLPLLFLVYAILLVYAISDP